MRFFRMSVITRRAKSRPELTVTTERLIAPVVAERLSSAQPPPAIDVRAPREREQKRQVLIAAGSSLERTKAHGTRAVPWLAYELYGITDEERKIIETYRNFRPLKLRLFQFFAYASQKLQERMWKSRKIEERILRYDL